MPKSCKGHRYILCVIDEATNYLITVPIYRAISEEIGDALIEHVISKYCIPEYLFMNLDSTVMLTVMNYLFRKLGIKIKTVVPYNHQSLQAEHGIKSLSTILTKHLTDQEEMWQEYLPFSMYVHNTYNAPNLGNFSPYELVFGRKPKKLLNLETNPDVRVSGTYKEYYAVIEKRLQYLHKVLQDFKSKQLALINKDHELFQYNIGDLVYLILPLTSQLRTAFRKVMIKYIGPLGVYKIIDLHYYLLMTLDGELMQGLFEHERMKPAVIRTNQGSVTNLSNLKQVLSAGILMR